MSPYRQVSSRPQARPRVAETLAWKARSCSRSLPRTRWPETKPRGVRTERSYLRHFVTLRDGPVAIKPQEQRQQRAARQDQSQREIRAKIAQLTDDPHDP